MLAKKGHMNTAFCRHCGEAAGNTGSMAGLTHRWGPKEHTFQPAALLPAWSQTLDITDPPRIPWMPWSKGRKRAYR